MTVQMNNAALPNTFSIKQVASSLRRRMPLAASLLGAALILGGCQTPPPPIPTTQVKPGVQILNAGDVIEITFPGATNLNTTQQIRRDGKVNLYMIGETPAANRSPGEFEKELIAAYSSQLISKEIKVKVVSSAFSVFVTGAVMKPGKVMSERELTAFDAIMEAGGFDEANANKKNVRIIRQDGGKIETFEIDFKKLLEGKGGEPFYLKAHDTIYVAPKITWF